MARQLDQRGSRISFQYASDHITPVFPGYGRSWAEQNRLVRFLSESHVFIEACAYVQFLNLSTILCSNVLYARASAAPIQSQ